MFSGRPRRSSGTILVNSASCFSSLSLRKSLVATVPGATALTVMLRPRNSFARTWTSPSTPAFEAMYGP